MARIELKPKTKTCEVCGKKLPIYMKICDRCWSIQRPVGGSGQLMEPVKPGVCVRCGKSIPEEDRYCDECRKAVQSGVKKLRKFQLKKAKMLAKGAGAGEREAGNEGPPVTVCRSCGSPMTSSLKICDRCGAVQEPAADSGEEWRCMNCGRVVPEKAALCEYCAKDLLSKAKRSRRAEARIKSVGFASLIIAVASIAIAIWAIVNIAAGGAYILALALSLVVLAAASVSFVIVILKLRKHYRHLTEKYISGYPERK